jgi:H+-transporting ATPase
VNDRPQLQTMMYLLLSVAGHLTIFQTRTRGPWWSIRPARILLLAVVGTQALATAICLFGFLVTPLWWGWAALVWGYALSWFLVTDPLKLLAYRYLDATKKAAPKRQGALNAAEPISAKAAEASPDPKAGPQSEAVDIKPELKAGPLPAPKSAPTPEAKSGAKPDDAKPEVTAGPQPEPKSAAAEPAIKIGPSSAPEPEPTSDAKSEGIALLDMKLGDILLAGIAKDPLDAGRLISRGMAEIEAARGPTPADPTVGAKPKPQPEPKSPPAPTPRAAE